MPILGVGLLIPVALVILWLISGIRIVNEHEQGVVLRLGRYAGVRTAGLTWIIPFIDRMILIDMRFAGERSLTEHNWSVVSARAEQNARARESGRVAARPLDRSLAGPVALREMREAKSRKQAQALGRRRAGFLIAALVLPVSLFLLGDRQARRLDALAAHGERVEARVTGIALHRGTTFYAYRVNGTEYEWNVSRHCAPFPVGQTFPVTYLPKDPSLSRPVKCSAAAEAAGNRTFWWAVTPSLALMLLFFAGVAHRDLRRIRQGLAGVRSPTSSPPGTD